MAPFKSDLSFDDLLRAGLGVPPKKGTPPSEERDADEDEQTEQSSEESGGRIRSVCPSAAVS